MPDTLTITCERLALAQTVSATIPEQMLQLLDWIVANVKNTDGTPKYLHAPNVIWQDALAILVPTWKQTYLDGQLAEARATLAAQAQAALDAATAQVDAAVAALVINDPARP